MEYPLTENTGPGSLNLLEDETALLHEYVYASTGQRFLNFLIDNLLMRYGVNYLTGYAIGLVIALSYPEFLSNIGTNSLSFFLLAYLISIINYCIYYIICEKLFNGYTLGKIITGTKAIREDGNPLTLKDAFIRTICRLVPFEAFSGFKTRPWHDEWSKTMVIKAR
jgi:uncharacterized RDD family membrane protein YckC